MVKGRIRVRVNIHPSTIFFKTETNKVLAVILEMMEIACHCSVKNSCTVAALS